MKEATTLPTGAEVTRRLQIVTELRNLCLSLGRARRTGEAMCEEELGGQARAQMQLGKENRLTVISKGKPLYKSCFPQDF